MTTLYSRLRLRSSQKILALFLFLISFNSEAALSTFTTRQSGNFNDASTWSSGTIPGALDKIVVEEGHILTINVHTPVLGEVNIQAGGELRGDGSGKVLSLGSANGHDLKNYGIINFSGSNAASIKLVNNGKWSGSGIYNLTDIDLNHKALDFTANGKYTINLSGAEPIVNPGVMDGKSKILFRFNGTVPQSLPAMPSITYGEIEIANPAGVYLKGDLTSRNLLTHLTLTKGFLNMDGHQIQGRPGASIDHQTLELGPETTLIVEGTSAFPSNFHAYVLDITSTVRYTGRKSQTVKALPYGHLEISGERDNETIYFEPATTGVAGTLLASATFTRGGYSVSNSMLALNGAGDQDIALENTELKLNGLTVSGGGTKKMVGEENLQVQNLVFNNGVLSTSPVTSIQILPGGAVTGAKAGSYVNGNLAKQVPIGVKKTVTFEIGDDNGYNPSTLTFPAVATPGVITVGLFPAAVGDKQRSRVKPQNRVNKTWKITNDGLSPAVYSTTFNFSQQDLTAGSMNKFEVNIFTPNTYERIVLDELQQPSVSVSNVSAFGYVQIGEYNKLVVNAKIFLEGAYAGNKKMKTTLKNVLPFTHPYTAFTQPYAATYGYDEAVSQDFFALNNGIVDWVLVELRTGTEASTTVAKKACLVREDGQLVDTDGTNPPLFLGLLAGDYYIVIRHRNHLSVMSSQPLSLHEHTDLYDFTTNRSQYFGGEAALLSGGVYGLYGGDADNSSFITPSDVIPISAGLNWTGYFPADLNFSGNITLTDRTLIYKNVNKFTRVP